MTGFGAIVKAFAGWLDGVLTQAGRGLRLTLAPGQPRPCPIPVRDEAALRRGLDSR